MDETTEMMGINLAGPEFGSKFPGTYNVDYTYPAASELDYYKEKGLTLVRLPFSWERMQPTQFGSLDSAEVGRMKAFLAAAQERGMQVILDAHNYGRYYGDVIGSSSVPVAAFQDFWQKMAQQFGGSGAVYGYDIMNEPHDMGGANVWPTAAQAAVDAIRTVDMKTEIIVEGDAWSTAATWQSVNAHLLVKDPANKVMYEAHQYFDHNNTGVYAGSYDQEGAYPTIGSDRVQPFIDWLNQNNVRGYIGEYGVPDNDPRWLTVLDNFLSTLEKNGVSGTYWAGGPWWGGTSLAVEPVNGQDRPQMSVLVKHEGADMPTPSPDPSSAGMDILTLHLSEDAWQGHAQFTVDVDGHQVLGPTDATASHAAGASQAFTISGDFGGGAHAVAVHFINDGYGGSVSQDRNLYIDGAEINGQPVSGAAAPLYSSGAKTFSVTTDSSSSVLTFHLAGDSYNGAPQCQITVDGKPLGGAIDVTAAHAANQWQDVTLTGAFDTSVAHEIGVTFLNDAYGGPGADRNLFVDYVEVNGHRLEGETAHSNTGAVGLEWMDPHAAVLVTNGTASFTVPADYWHHA